MLKNLFPNMGEVILKEIISQEPELVLTPLGINISEFVSTHTQLPLFFSNSSVKFDGFSTIDLGLKLKSDIVLPIEVKVGKTGLARAEINKKLTPCSLSKYKNEKRVSGNVLSVFNRYFDKSLSLAIGQSVLSTEIENKTYKVSESWGVIARNSIINSWQKFPPNFNSSKRLINLENLCSKYGSSKFNSLVAATLTHEDYYSIWVDN